MAKPHIRLHYLPTRPYDNGNPWFTSLPRNGQQLVPVSLRCPNAEFAIHAMTRFLAGLATRNEIRMCLP